MEGWGVLWKKDIEKRPVNMQKRPIHMKKRWIKKRFAFFLLWNWGVGCALQKIEGWLVLCICEGLFLQSTPLPSIPHQKVSGSRVCPSRLYMYGSLVHIHRSLLYMRISLLQSTSPPSIPHQKVSGSLVYPSLLYPSLFNMYGSLLYIHRSLLYMHISLLCISFEHLFCVFLLYIRTSLL